MLSSNIPLLNKKIAPRHKKITLLGATFSFLFYKTNEERKAWDVTEFPHPKL
jgi:hypothetical protein